MRGARGGSAGGLGLTHTSTQVSLRNSYLIIAEEAGNDTICTVAICVMAAATCVAVRSPREGRKD